MPIKRRKDRSNLKGTLVLKSTEKPHYYNVYLWNDVRSMYENVYTQEAGRTYDEIGTDNEILGFCVFNTYLYDPEKRLPNPSPLLGEIHFIAGRWDELVVAHELQHAILHRMRVLRPLAREVMKQVKSKVWYGNAEEDICHEYGRWFSKLYRWLWEIDAHGKHA